VGVNGGTITNSYATGSVSGDIHLVGGLVGGNGGTITNSFYDSQTTGQADTGKGTPKTTAEMKQMATFTGWDFWRVWGLSRDKNNGYPYFLDESEVLRGDGSVYSPWIIKTPGQLFSVRDYLGSTHADKHFKLGNDIVLNDTAGWKNWSADNAPANSWVPIGASATTSVLFYGNLDGAGFVVRGIYINTTASDQGLFGNVNGGTIKNLGVVDFFIKGGTRIGGLATRLSSGGSITNSYAMGNAVGTTNIGGLVGVSTNGSTITNSYATVNVDANSNFVGGLVGQINESTITNSYATGAVKGVGEIGGLIGGGAGSTVTNSFYDSQTTGQADTGKGTPKTTAEMKQAATFTGWDFTEIWKISNGDSYPRLAWQVGGPVSISRGIASRGINQTHLAPTATIRGKTLNVRTSSPADLQVRLIDMRGRTLIRFNTQGNGGSFSLNKVSAGYYLVDMRDVSSGRRFTSSVIVR
jgi:hypothetical protein